MIIETVNAPVLKHFVEMLLDESDELPAGLQECVNVFEKPTIGIRKTNSKKTKGEN